LPGEHDGNAEGLPEIGADDAPTAQNHDDVVAEHGGRQHHGQGEDGVHQVPTGELSGTGQPGQGDRRQGGGGGGQARDLQGKEQGRQDVGIKHDGGLSWVVCGKQVRWQGLVRENGHGMEKRIGEGSFLV